MFDSLVDAVDTDSDLDEADFEEISFVRWEVLLAAFGILVLVIAGGAWVFEATMTTMAEDRVREARSILRQEEDLADLKLASGPWTEEIRRLRTLQMEVGRALLAENDRRNLDAELERRFREQMLTHEQPEDWRDRLPSDLEQWYQTRREEQRQSIEQLFGRVREGVDRSLRLLEQLISIEREELPGAFQPYWERSQHEFFHLEREIEQLRDELPSDADAPRLSDETFGRINDFTAHLSDLIRHLFRAQALADRWQGWLYAEQLLHDALRIRPDYPPAFRGLGDAYRKVGLTRVADHYYRQVVRVEPHGADADWIQDHFEQRREDGGSNWNRYNRAFLAHQRGDESEAEQLLMDILDEGPDDPLLVYLVERRLKYLEDGVPPYSKAAYF